MCIRDRLLILGLLCKLAHDQLGRGGLVLDEIRAALLGSAGHFLGHFQAAVVVDTGLGDNGYRHRNLLFLQ